MKEVPVHLQDNIYKEVIEASNSGIVIVDQNDFSLIYANQVACEIAQRVGQSYENMHCYDYMWNKACICEECCIRNHQDCFETERFVPETGRYYCNYVKKMDWNGRKVFAAFLIDITESKHQVETVQNKDRLLKQAVDDAKLLSWEYDIKTKHLLNENKTLQHAGYVGTPILPEMQIEEGYVEPNSIDDYRKMFERIFAGESLVVGEIWFYRNRDTKDRHCIRISYTVYGDDSGKPVKASGLGLDVTKEKLEIEKYKHNVKVLLEMNPNVLGSFHVNLTHDIVNDACIHNETVYDVSECETLDEYLHNVEKILPDEKECQEYKRIFSRDHLLREYEDGKDIVSYEHRCEFINHQIRWIKTIAQLLMNPESKDVEAVIYASDIHDQILGKQISQQLVDKEYDIVALIDVKRKLVDFRYIGKNFQGIQAMSIEEYDTNRYEAASEIFDEEQSKIYITYTELGYIQKQLDEKGQFAFTMNMKDANHRKLYKQYSYSYLGEDSNHIVVFVQDVTRVYEQEREQMHQVQLALDEAKKANAAKSIFLSNLSHDIRTPMNAIINMVKLAYDDLDDKQMLKNDLQKIDTSSEFLLGLINDILDMSKIESGKMELHNQVYHYDEFLNYINCVFTPLCQKKDIIFEWEKGSTAVDIFIDKVRFNQIFFNLISNAIKYTPEGGTVTYRVINNSIKDNILTCDFVISDTGCGMSEEFQKKLFRPFEREERSMAMSTGTGLGLSIAKSIIDMMGGTIAVKSAIDQGTEISIHLSMPIPTAEQKDKVERKNQTLQNDLQGKHVLIAEDHPLNQEIIERLLKKIKVETTCANNGKEAVKMLMDSRPGTFDGILMDVRMPVMDGLEATRRIRESGHPDALGIPIIAMTANAFEEDKRQTMEAGMNTHLSKPIEIEKLYAVLQEYL